ncbi:MAG: Transketolase central region [Synergistales bacterium 53_16]|nr:MAG: Transketolase central region [Synergistales bacterium 53_16]HAG21675.1 transketolase [Synergistaceae bacterium]
MTAVPLDKNLWTEVEKIPTRFGYGDGLVELGETNPNVVVLGADLTSSLRVDRFRDTFPERFIQTGIAEQDMMNLAAGLSLVGKIPFVSTYGFFCTGRAWDQLRTTVAYGGLNVKVGSGHGGISVGPDGATHQALEDIAITRTIPGMTVIVPCDYHETIKAVKAAAEIVGPVVVRFGREKVPVITTPDTPFEVGKAQVFRDGFDVTIMACGVMVYESLKAARMLEEEGVSARVLNCPTVKPMDIKAVVESALETGAVVTAEEHQVMGGFGSAVAEVLCRHAPVPVRMVGIQDVFGQSGSPEELMESYGLTAQAVAGAVRDVLEMKKR